MAAVRLYLANVAATYTPPTIRGTWSDKALTGASGLLRRKTGAGTTAAKAETSSSNTWSTLLRRFVSEPINNAATLDGAASVCFGARVSGGNSTNKPADANMVPQLHIYVTVGNTDVVRGALTSTALVGGTEFASEFGAAGVLSTIAALTAVNAQVGDRIVVELGYRSQNTFTTSVTGTMNYGGTASDLTDGDNATSTHPGWVEFQGSGFSTALAPPKRTGSTTSTLSVGSSLPTARKQRSVSIDTIPAPASSLQDAHKSMLVVTGNVRPPGRPEGEPETGSITTGQSFRSGSTTTAPSVGMPGDAVRIATVAAPSVTNCTPKIIPFVMVPGDHDLSPPDIDLLTAPPPPQPQAPLRFIAQDIRTHRFLSWDLPLIDPKIIWTLSGPSTLSARLHPESPTLRELNIDPWATWIHIDQDGQLLGTMVLQPAKIDGEEYTVEAIGFSGYAQGLPFFGEEQLIQTDACDVMRIIWNHLQSYPDAGLGVRVNDAMSGTLLGIPSLQSVDENGQLEYEDGVEVKPPTREVTQDELEIISQVRDPDTGVITATYNDGAVYTFAPKMDEAKPYVLSWYSDTDCGQEFDNLAKTAKIDYRESVAWQTTGDVSVIPVPLRVIEMGYPRLGRKRFDLRCAQDENMLAAIPLEELSGDQGYASQIMMRGVGEGRDAIRGYAGQADPHRVRRVAIVTDQTITTLAGANTGATDELLRRRGAVTVGQVVLMDWHPNAPLGSYAVGDELLVTGFVPWAGFIELWHRIITIDWEPQRNIVTLTMRRSEQFGYGAPLPDPPPVPQVVSAYTPQGGRP